MTAPELGERITPFEGTNQYGQQAAIPGGTWWLLFFYPYAFTGVCTREVTGLSRLRPEFVRAGCRVAACSTDTMFTLRVFADTERIDVDLLSDHWPHGRAAQLYGAFDDQLGCARRASFLIDGAGRVAWRTGGELPESRDLEAHLGAARSLVGGTGQAGAGRG